MKGELDRVAWPFARLGEGMRALAERAGLGTSGRDPGSPCDDALQGGEVLRRYVHGAARALGLEAEPTAVSVSEVAAMLRSAAPALLFLENGRVVLLVAARGSHVRCLAPDQSIQDVDVGLLETAFAASAVEPVRREIEELLSDVGVARSRAERAIAKIVADRLRGEPLAGCWLLRYPPGGSIARQARRAGLPWRAATLLVATVLEYGLGVLAFAVLGEGALEGRIEPGWLWAFALLLGALIPCRLAATWASRTFALRAGALLKSRLLAGALRLSPDDLRGQGVGQLLGKVIESEAVETLGLAGMLDLAIGLVEIAICGGVLAMGAAPIQVVVLGMGIAATVLLSARSLRARRSWAAARLRLTHDLVERMIGHRTRLAQERDWHGDEDAPQSAYLGAAREMDRAEAFLATVPSAWIVAGFAALAMAIATGRASAGLLAASIGGVLLGARGFSRLAAASGSLSDAWIAWDQIAPIARAAAEPEVVPAPALLSPTAPADRQTILIARDVGYRYRDRGEPVLRGATLSVERGDKVLLEGVSGSGKSTLAALISGLRRPSTGLLTVRGLDGPTLGLDGWRRHVACAPQFHENHVFSQSLAFNLLLGRNWPPISADYALAEEICTELGLAELLARMPSGFDEQLGESGWQLSHGEKGRLFVARALLQGTELVVLDESFASLDPETLGRALACVVARAPALVLIAHP
ncbi:MAG: ABC transporter ATP-binding protein [Acidobacteriota bacterium]